MNGSEDSEEDTQEHIATVVQGIERFIAAGQNPEATALLDQLIPVIAHGISFVEEADEVGLFSGLALACARLSRLDDAQNYAGRAIIENPIDLLAHALLTPEARIAIARQLIHHQRHDIARDLLKTVGMTGQTDEGAFYLELLDFYDTQKALARRLAPQPASDDSRPTLISLVVWGEALVRRCLDFDLPSLLAPGNIPALAAQGVVILDIFTAEADQDRLLQDPLFDTLQKFAEIRVTIIPDTLLGHAASDTTPDPDRWCIAGAQHTSAIAARHLDADLVFVSTGNIYSESYLSGAKQHIEDGLSAVVTTALRAEEAPVAEQLASQGDGSSGLLEVDSAALLSYSLLYTPELFADAFINANGSAAEEVPVAVFFSLESGFCAHTFQFHPVMISSDLLPDDFIFDFNTANARFLAEIVDGRDAEALIKVIDEPIGDIALLQLEPNDGAENDVLFPVTPESCAQAALDLCNRESDLPYFLWSLRQRFTVDFGDLAIELPESDLDETDTVEKILDHFEEGVAETSRRIRFYSGMLS
jgi:hypothetical protein